MDSPIWQGFAGGGLAGLATGIGALGVYGVRELSRTANDALLSCAAGIMLAATFFSLLAPAIEVALGGGSRVFASAVVAVGVVAGAAVLTGVHRLVPHEH